MRFWRDLTPDERTAAINQFCEPGMSRQTMAYVLARDASIFEATRNAIISHIARRMPQWPRAVRKTPAKPTINGKRPWRRTVSPPNRTETRLRRATDLANPPPAAPVAAADPEGRNKILLDDMPMLGRCRYALWPNNSFPKPHEMFFCGEPTHGETSWCRFHHQRCITIHQPKPLLMKKERADARAA